MQAVEEYKLSALQRALEELCLKISESTSLVDVIVAAGIVLAQIQQIDLL
jgi:hypothetical protein